MYLKIIIACFFLMSGLFAINASSASYSLDNFHYGLTGGNGTSANYEGRETLTHQQAGNQHALSFHYFANFGWFNISFSVPSGVLSIVSDLFFTNATIGHWFFADATASYTLGGNLIDSVSINISSASCIQYSNSTSGENFSTSFKCTALSPSSPFLNITFSATGIYVITSTLQNTFPDYMPSLSPPLITPTPAYTNGSLLCNAGTFTDSDNDTESLPARTWAWYNNSVLMVGQTNQTLAKQYLGAGNIIQCQENSTASTWFNSKASAISFQVIMNQWGVYLEIVGFWALLCLALILMAEISPYNLTAGIIGAFLLVFMGAWILGQPIIIHTGDTSISSGNLTTNTTISNITYLTQIQNKSLNYVYTPIYTPVFDFNQILGIIFCLIGILAGLRYALKLKG